MSSALVEEAPRSDPAIGQIENTELQSPSKKKKSVRRRKASNSQARQASNDADVLSPPPRSSFESPEPKTPTPSIKVAPLDTNESALAAQKPQILSPSALSPLSPTLRSSRNSNGGNSFRSKRKTSVDQRYEAEAEMNDIENEMLANAKKKATKNIRKVSAQRQLEPLLTASAPQIPGDTLSVPPQPEEADSLTIRTKKGKKKKKKKIDANAVPFPEDPFDIAMAQAEREPSETAFSASTKKVSKKSAMPLLEENKGPMQLDMAALIRLQEESKVPINLNIQMNVDEKELANEMIKKMNVPVPQPQVVAPPRPAPKPQQLKEESSSGSSDSSGGESSGSEESEEEKFTAVQRYKVKAPLVLKQEQIHRIREPERFEKKVVVKTKKQLYQEQQARAKEEARADVATEEQENVMMFTDSEDDSVDTDDEEMTENEKRLVNVFWRTRNWVILQNQGLFRMLLSQTNSISVIFTPISPDQQVKAAERQIRFASLETKLDAIFKNLLKGMNMVEGTQPLMMNFMRYLSYDKSSIPEKFLLPLEQKLILFNDNRQRQLRDDRDKGTLVGAFLFCKVIAGKLLFKPYKLTGFFETEVSALENPIIFKENCLALGYSIIALFTDLMYAEYKVELERIEGKQLTKSADIAKCKQTMFQDLMPIADDYVLYKDFAQVTKRSEWLRMVSQMKAIVQKTLEQVKAHRHLTDAGLQQRAKEDLQELIAIRTRQYNQIKKQVSTRRHERHIREAIDDDSSDSDGEKARAKELAKKKAALKAKQAAAQKAGGGK